MAKGVVCESLDEVSYMVVSDADCHGVVASRVVGGGECACRTKPATQSTEAGGFVGIGVEAEAQSVGARVEGGPSVVGQTPGRFVLSGSVAKQTSTLVCVQVK